MRAVPLAHHPQQPAVGRGSDGLCARCHVRLLPRRLHLQSDAHTMSAVPRGPLPAGRHLRAMHWQPVRTAIRRRDRLPALHARFHRGHRPLELHTMPARHLPPGTVRGSMHHTHTRACALARPSRAAPPRRTNTTCTLAPRGTFVSVVNATTPSPCPAGTQGVVQGASVCETCGTGTYQNSTGQTSCIACPAGSARIHPDGGAATLALACTACAPGSVTINPVVGARECTLCPAGTYQQGNTCPSCTNNTYRRGSASAARIAPLTRPRTSLPAAPPPLPSQCRRRHRLHTLRLWHHHQQQLPCLRRLPHRPIPRPRLKRHLHGCVTGLLRAVRGGA